MRSCNLETKYRWVYPETKQVSPELVKVAGSHIVAQLLINRGFDTPEQVKSFLSIDDTKISSPDVFKHMEKAVNRINQAIEKQEHIIIYGDFDADGVTSTSLLFKTLLHLSANVSYFIPDRSEEGHGLNSASICKLISSKKAKLIITVDCGISNIAEIALAKSLGTDVIITDHHEALDVLPSAFAIINPKLIEENSDLKYLAGVGVAYKLAAGLLESHNRTDYLDNILCLVAVGTIADVVPLIGENRALVHQGLKLLSRDKAPGLVKLLEIAGCNLDQVSATSIAFGVAPRINAIGRLAEAGLAVELLVSDNAEEIENIAKKLNTNNKIRQQMCETTLIEALSKVNSECDLEREKAIVLADPNWHPGIIGIVASKLVEKFYRPVFLISVDEEKNMARCSARSIEGVNLHETLTHNAEMFEVFGGHAFAAGFSLDLNKTSFEQLKNRLLSTVNKFSGSDFLEPKLKVDLDINSCDLSIELIEELDKLAPFGECNPFPVFSISNLTLKQFKTMGSANNHLKIFLADEEDNIFEAVWWQKNNLDIAVLDKVNVAFAPDINTFAGKMKVQLVVKDIQKTGSSIKQSPSIKNKPETFSIPNILNNITSCEQKWVDHRGKANFEKSLTNYLKLSKNNCVIFAENPCSLEILGTDPVLKSRIINRLSVEKVDELFIFDLPPDLDSLTSLLEKAEANIVHIIGKPNTETDPNKIIKTMSGMLKYAHSNKNGEIRLYQIASLLYISNDIVYSCIDLLNKAGIIQVFQQETDKIKFGFLGSKDLSSITTLDEYNCFIDTIKTSDKFRYQLTMLDIESIQNLI
ncbi:MAG: hypothetical protein ACD_20C00395G0026 [uncultured bacterium]|nr:MAG: hypothetical protein ACD_20C00395G0026 [uncultured bacterium]